MWLRFWGLDRLPIGFVSGEYVMKSHLAWWFGRDDVLGGMEPRGWKVMDRRELVAVGCRCCCCLLEFFFFF